VPFLGAFCHEHYVEGYAEFLAKPRRPARPQLFYSSQMNSR
jgi:hypothetical protein